MRGWIPTRSVGWLAVGVVVGVAFGAGIAVASIPSATGTILGCYHRNESGPPYPLSVVDSAKSCSGSSMLLPFSQTGPVGPTGPAGHLGASVVSRLERDLAAVDSQLKATEAQLATQVRAADRIFGLEQRFAASHLPDFGKVERKLRQIVGPRAARQLLSGVPKPPTGSAQWGRAGSDLKRGLDAQSELGEMTSLALQMSMDRMSKFEVAISNMLKEISDSQNAIIQNLK